MKFGTKAIHAGIEPDASTGAIMTPIFQTSTYAQDSPGVHRGFEYGRTQNPTRSVLEKNLAALENGSHSIVFSSGLSALDAVIRLLEPGDEILATNDLYGGTYRQLTAIHGKMGIQSKFVDMYNPEHLIDLISSQTKLLWIETPTNPMLNIIDIEKICSIAKQKNILTCVDNTFASPYLQNPIDLGADIVVHSATKYIGGHSDVILGAVIVKDENLAKKLYYIQNAVGAIPGPQDCFLILRGIKTLHIRVERACFNARKIASFLKTHPKISKVYFPGFEDHPNHQIAKSQMRDFGAMVSFDLTKDSYEFAEKILSNTRLFTLAESLG